MLCVQALAGPDVIVGNLTGPSHAGGNGPHKWGTIAGVTAYSFGTDSCNVGDEPLAWFFDTRFHPVILQNVYRLRSRRFEQIGMAWIKHAFAAFQFELCSPCTPEPGFSLLGVGCSDPYSSITNGAQESLGPRSEVNATTGVFDFPYSTQGMTGDVLYKRIQIANADLDPALNPGALYFAEGHYIHPDDAGVADDNNASYRRFSVGPFEEGGFQLNWADPVHRRMPAIQAWQDTDPGVQLTPVDVPGDGRFWVGSRVTDNLDGTWRYEYAVENLNSDRSAGGLAVPIVGFVGVTGVGFHDIDYHSGEPFDPTDWTATVSATEVAWASPQTFDQNPDSNALRFSTIYNFRFTADTPPIAGQVTLLLFKPGVPGEIAADASVPGPGRCLADIDGDGDADVADFFAFVSAFAAGDPAADLNRDGSVDVNDFFAFVASFSAGCP